MVNAGNFGIKMENQKFERHPREFFHDNRVTIRRQYIYEDAFEKLSTQTGALAKLCCV